MKLIIENWQRFIENKSSEPAVVFTSADGKEVLFHVALARSPEELQRGLMFQKTLPINDGMLLIFPHSERQHLWMKNTFIPLDMIHINREKQIVGIVENARPHDKRPRGVGEPALYVLEINAGLVRRKGINKQWNVRFIGI